MSAQATGSKLRETWNTLTMAAPLCVSAAFLIYEGPETRTVAVFVGWALHLPAAVAFHIAVAFEQKCQEKMLRIDRVMQFVAAFCNAIGQGYDNPLFMLLFALLSVSLMIHAGLADYSHAIHVHGHAHAIAIALATTLSCVPMVFDGRALEFAAAIALLISGGAITRIDKNLFHGWAYGIFHLVLGVFTWVLLL